MLCGGFPVGRDVGRFFRLHPVFVVPGTAGWQGALTGARRRSLGGVARRVVIRFLLPFGGGFLVFFGLVFGGTFVLVEVPHHLLSEGAEEVTVGRLIEAHF